MEIYSDQVYFDNFCNFDDAQKYTTKNTDAIK